MDTKSRIMETSFKLFLEKGFTDVTMSEIKKASNITTGGFYHHFNSKDDLVVQIIDKYLFKYFKSTLNQIRKVKGTPKEKLINAVLSLVGDDTKIHNTTRLVESHEKIDYKALHLLLLEGVHKYDLISQKYTKFFYNLFNFIKEVIEEGIDQDLIKDNVDVVELSLLIHTVMAGTVIIWIGMPQLSLEERMISNINHIWNYIKK